MIYKEAVEYIHSLNKFGSRPGLDNIGRLLKALGEPQKKLKIIHVAGTNGKGSTCSFISSVLREHNLKVGLYISPFVVCFNERIQINGEYIPNDKLAEYTAKVKKATDSVNDHQNPITEFEFITALGFCYFADEKCDAVVLEVGLGGRLDATNIIESPCVSVITKIDLDHTGVLGDTIEKIAAEKCGIIKGNCPTVTASDNSPEALEVIKQVACQKTSCLTVADISKAKVLSSNIFGSCFEYGKETYSISLPGLHQISNAVTAINALRVAFPDISDRAIIKGLKSTSLPARCEIISSEPPVLLDGSHNPNGTMALNRLLNGSSFDGGVAVVGFMADKDVRDALQMLSGRFSHVISVEVKSNSRSMKANELKDVCRELFDSTDSAESYDEAVQKATAFNKPIVVFGSLYLAGDIRPVLISRFSTKDN